MKAQYPGLDLKSPGVLEGVFHLHHRFQDITLEDTFSIRIVAIPDSRMPVLSEIGGRTAEIVTKHKLEDSKDVHCNTGDGTACVCVPQEVPAKFPIGSSLLDYIEKLAVPYLYGLSYYDKYGSWPWGEYSHGGLGLVEFYATAPEQKKENYQEVIQALKGYNDIWPAFKKQLRKPSAKRACICGSGKPFGKCHAEAWRGVRQMRTALMRLGLSPQRMTG